jgi:WD40 repeat protein
LLLLAALAVVLRVATDQGELEVRAAEEVEIRVLRGGKPIDLIDPASRQTVRLRAGTYHLEVVGGKAPLLLSTDTFTLKRGEKILVEVKPPSTGDSGKRVGKPRVLRALAGRRDMVYSIGFSADGRLAASSGGIRRGRGDAPGREYDVHVWDVSRERELVRLRGHTDRVRCVGFTPNGRQVLSGGADGTVRLWEVEGGKPTAQARAPHVLALAVSPDGTHALSAHFPAALHLWKLPSLEEAAVWKGLADIAWTLAFSPKGDLAASAGGEMDWRRRSAAPRGDYDVWLWEAATGRMLHRFKGHTLTVWSVAFTPDGKRLLSGGADGTIRLWDVAGKKEHKQLRRAGESLVGVSSLAVTADGRHVVSADSEGAVCIHEIESGRQVHRLEGDFSAVACSPKGGAVLFGGKSSLSLWHWPGR